MELEISRILGNRASTLHTSELCRLAGKSSHSRAIPGHLDFRYLVDIYLDGAFAGIAASAGNRCAN